MQFNRIGNRFKIARITGPHHNFLGLEVAETSASSRPMIEAFPAIGKQPGTLQMDAVQQNVLEGVEEANRQFGTKYTVNRIEFVSDDSPPAETYKLLAYSIIERLAKGLPFTENA